MPDTEPLTPGRDAVPPSPAMAVATERELKLAAHPGFELPDLGAAVPGLLVTRTAELDLDAVYHDTDDLRLARRGVTLRRRTGDGEPVWTLKFPAGTHDGKVLSRRELDVVAMSPDENAVPTALVDLVTAYVRSTALAPVARLRTVRQRLELVDPDGVSLGEVDDDEVSVLDDGRVLARFREVEVEFTPAASADLGKVLTKALRAAGAGAPDPTPKLVRALGPRALAPPELAPVEVDAGATVGSLLAAGLVNATRLVLDHDHVIRLDDDIEGVHRARVGTRRLRSNLRTFRSALEPEWAEPLRDELKWLGAALGGVRDTDVLLVALAADVDALPAEADRAAGERLLAGLAAERGAALDALLVDLRTERYVRLLDRLVGAALQPVLTDAAEVAASTVAPRLVRKRWRKLRRGVKALSEHPTDGELHAIRMLAKRVRYATDIVLPVTGPEAAEFATALGRLQDVLGDLHDTAVAQEWLRHAAAGSPKDEALVAGELIAGRQKVAAARRSEWPAAWQAADRKRLTGWMR